jgi:hypothetical protein
MEKVIAAYGCTIAVSGKTDEIEIGPRHLHPRCNGKYPAVMGVDIVTLP